MNQRRKRSSLTKLRKKKLNKIKNKNKNKKQLHQRSR